MDDFIKDVDVLAGEIPFGDLEISLKRHNGKTTQLGVNSFEKQKFKSSSEAMTYLLTEVKKLADLGKDGSISFTLMLKDGKIISIIQQSYTSKDYR